MNSDSNETGHNMSWNDIGGRDILKKISLEILRTCPSYVLYPQMCPQTFKRTGQAIQTKLAGISSFSIANQPSFLTPIPNIPIQESKVHTMSPGFHTLLSTNQPPPWASPDEMTTHNIHQIQSISYIITISLTVLVIISCPG